MILEQLAKVQEGWTVVGSDGGKIGSVTDRAESHLVVEHGLINKQSLYVPVSAVASVRDGEVTLSLPAGTAGEMGWHVPPGAAQPAGPGPRKSGQSGTTTMTGAGYGVGYGPAAAGPLGPNDGDSIHDRLGGSSRAGLGRAKPAGAGDDEEVASEPAGGEWRDEERGDGSPA